MEAARTTPRRFCDLAARGRVERAAALLSEHEPALWRVARRFCSSEADAEDALQRAVEILLRKGPEEQGRRLLAWMRVVTRREAIAVGREARRVPLNHGGDGFDPERLAGSALDPAAATEHRERVAEAAHALGRLKPQERRALALQAAGCSYAEIQAITGWTYTKVNRCLAEGRAALREARGAGPINRASPRTS
jgi:RNA polymerase sigma factor (sigma-70 family)